MRGILSRDIPENWEWISETIKRHEEKTGFLRWYPLEYIYRELTQRRWQCWTAEETVFLTTIGVYPSGIKELDVLLVCGSSMDGWDKDAWTMLKEYAAAYRCDEITFEGRPGWRRYGKRFEPDLKSTYKYRVKI